MLLKRGYEDVAWLRIVSNECCRGLTKSQN